MLHKFLDMIFSFSVGCGLMLLAGFLVLWWNSIQSRIYGYTSKQSKVIGMVMLLCWGLNVGMFLYIIGHALTKAW